jgi:hypothetical protein
VVLGQSIKIAEMENKPFAYCAEYTMNANEVPDLKRKCAEVADEVWEATGYRFTYVRYPLLNLSLNYSVPGIIPIAPWLGVFIRECGVASH